MLRVLCEWRRRAVLITPAVLLSVGAWAQQGPAAHTQSEDAQPSGLDLSLIAGATLSDNIARVAEDEENSTIGRAGLLLNYQQDSRRIETDIDVNAMYERYTDDTFDDEIVGGVDARLSLGIVPERFLWAFQENFGQITLDPFAASTPDNRENINYFTTGPDLVLRLGGAMSLKLSGRYSDTDYELSDFDGQEYAGTLALSRELSSASIASLLLESNRFEFDNELTNEDYDRKQAFLRYQLQGSRTDLTIDGGYATIDTGGETSGGVLARITLSRRISSNADLTFGIGRQISDAGDLFRDEQQFSGVSGNPSNVQASSDPFESRLARVGYSFQRNRTGIGASVVYREESYEVETSLDRDVTMWTFYFSRQLSPVFELRLFAEAERQKFENVDFDSDELRGGGYLSWALGRELSLRLQYDRMDRSSSDATTEYTENQVSLFLRWSPVQRR